MIGIVQYGTGNVHAVVRALERCGVTPMVVNRPEEIERCDKVIFPGVGHFKNAMDQLNKEGWIPFLKDFALVKRKPFLGICLGMQLLSNESEEGNISGLGFIEGRVVKMLNDGEVKIKIPHMGWNQLHSMNGNFLSKVTQEDFFYFTHSYHWENVQDENILCKTKYGKDIITGVIKNNIIGVQFHPEKSYESGKKVLESFIQLM